MKCYHLQLLLILILSTIFSIDLFGQDLKTLADFHHDKAKSFNRVNNDSLRYHAQKSIDYALRANYPEGLVRANYIMGKIDEFTANYQRSTQYYFDVIKYLEDVSPTDEMLRFEVLVNINLGTLLGKYDKNEESIIYYDKGLEMSKAHGFDDLTLELMLRKAVSLNYQKKFSQALEILDALYNTAQDIEDLRMMARSKLLLGDVARNSGDIQLSIKFYNDVLRFKNAEGYLHISGEAYHELGEIYVEQNEAENAIASFKNAVKNRLSSKYPYAALQSYRNLGKLYLDRKQYAEAEKALLSALQFNYPNDFDRMKQNAYLYLAQLYIIQGRTEEHLKYDKLYTDMLKSENKTKEDLLKTERSNNLVLVLKQHEEAISENANTIKQQNIIITLGALSTFLILAILVYAIIVQIRKRNQLTYQVQNQLLQSELKALRSQINPHFLFNALNSIQKFVVKNDTLAAEKYLNNFSKLMRYTLDHSDKMTVSIQEEVNNLEMYIKMEQLRAGFKFDYSINIDEELDAYITNVPAMILQPFVENAIWHGLVPNETTGNLEISFTSMKDQILMRVMDDGVGFDLEQKTISKNGHSSAGMRLITERIDLLQNYFKQDFQLQVLSNQSERQGTQVNITVPNDLV